MTGQGVDYVAVLREVGFDQAWALRGAQLIESESRAGDYKGFRLAVNLLKIQGANTVWHEHQVEPVVRRVEAQEAASRISEHAGRAGLRVAASRAQEAEDRAHQVELERVRGQQLREVAARMTDDEYEGRVPLRPEIEEAFREAAGYDGELRVGTRPRPSWTGRAPAPTVNSPGLKRLLTEINETGQILHPIKEADAETSPSAATTDDSADPGLVERFKALGLSDEAAKTAATGR